MIFDRFGEVIFKMVAVTFLCLLLFSKGLSDTVYYDVDTDLGVITGHYDEKETKKGVVISEFEGIPYAKPPVGELRFRNPVSAEPFAAPHKATARKPLCFDSTVSADDTVSADYDEDCLYLDIFAPGLVSKMADKRHPVIVWISGADSSNQNTSQRSKIFKRLAGMEKVVVVKVNYRKSAFGFLTTMDKNAKGNYGLYDQRMALLWVNRNIGAFNGDPSKVTILGTFSAAESVLMHGFFEDGLDSETNNTKLFHRIVTVSSSFPSMFSQSEDMENFKILAKELYCFWHDVFNTIDCLRFAPVENILRAVRLSANHFNMKKPLHERFMNVFNTQQEFHPTKDGKFNPRLYKIALQVSDTRNMSAFNMLSKYDILLGISNPIKVIENQWSDVESLLSQREDLNDAIYDIQKEIEALLGNIYNLSSETNAIVKKILFFQYNLRQVTVKERSNQGLLTLVQILSDLLSFVPVIDIADRHSEAISSSRTFVYQHSPYLLTSSNVKVNKMESLFRVWGSFARHGHPTMRHEKRTAWPMYNSESRTYADFSDQEKQGNVLNGFREPISSVWTKLIPSIIQHTSQTNATSFSKCGSDVNVEELARSEDRKDRRVVFILTIVIATLLVILGVSCICLYKGSRKYVYRVNLSQEKM